MTPKNYAVRGGYTAQLTMKDLTRICAADVSSVGNDISRLRGFVDGSYAQFALLGVQLMWTTDVQSALEQARVFKFALSFFAGVIPSSV